VTGAGATILRQDPIDCLAPFFEEEGAAYPAIDEFPREGRGSATVLKPPFRFYADVFHGLLPQVEAESVRPAVKTTAQAESPFDEGRQFPVAPGEDAL